MSDEDAFYWGCADGAANDVKVQTLAGADGGFLVRPAHTLNQKVGAIPGFLVVDGARLRIAPRCLDSTSMLVFIPTPALLALAFASWVVKPERWATAFRDAKALGGLTDAACDSREELRAHMGVAARKMPDSARSLDIGDVIIVPLAPAAGRGRGANDNDRWFCELTGAQVGRPRAMRAARTPAAPQALRISTRRRCGLTPAYSDHRIQQKRARCAYAHTAQ